MADIKYIITADASGAIKSVQQVREEVSSAAKEAEKAEPKFAGMWKQIAGGVGAVVGVQQGLRALVSGVKGAINEALEAEKVSKALTVALEMTGRGGEAAAKRFEKFASELQRLTIYDDEAIKSATTLLAQLTNLDEFGLQKATKAAIGLSSVLGMDLQSAAMLVAKAMEGNVGALSRYGFKIDETLPKNQALNKLLDEMANLFERARRETETTIGSWKQIKNAISDWLEAQGKVIIQSPLVTSALKGIKDALNEINLSLDVANSKTSRYQIVVDDVAKFFRKWNEECGTLNNSLVINYGMATRLERKYLELGSDINKLVEFVMNAGPAWEKERQALMRLNPFIIQKGEALQQVSEQLDMTTQKTKKYELALIELPKGLSFTISKLEQISKVLPKWISGFPEIFQPLPNIDEGITKALMSEIPKIAQIENTIQKDWFSTWDRIKKFTSEKIDSIINSARSMVGQLSNLFGILQNNAEIRIENEYKARLDYINKTIKDEDKKNQAIMALEAEYEIKRTEARRKAAKEAKVVNIFQAIIDTAAAIVKTMREWGMPFAIPWMAMAGAIGAAQVAAIAAQPIPLAEGAVFERPTRMLAETGKTYLVGEAGTEILLPESKLRKIIRSEVGAQKIEISIPVLLNFGTQTIKQEIVKTVNLASRQGLIRIDPIRVDV